MSSGLFLLLCVLALFIGTRARRSKVLSPKGIKIKNKFKRILLITAIVFTSLLIILFVPTVFQEFKIAIDTRFNADLFINLGIVIISIFVLYTAIKKLKESKI